MFSYSNLGDTSLFFFFTDDMNQYDSTTQNNDIELLHDPGFFSELEKAYNKTKNFKDKLKEKYNKMKAKVAGKVAEVKEKVDKLKEKVKENVDKVKEKIDKIKENLKVKVAEVKNKINNELKCAKYLCCKHKVCDKPSTCDDADAKDCTD